MTKFRLDIDDVDTFIVSYPKSGRTWLRALIGKYLITKYDISERDFINIESITSQAPVDNVLLTHAGSSWMNEPEEVSDFKTYSDRKVILLERGIKDTLVSAFFHASYRNKIFHGNISQFIRDDEFGIKKILSFYKTWGDYCTKHLDNVLTITYEQLHENAGEILIQTLNFIGEENINHLSVEKSVEECSFHNLQKIENQKKILSRKSYLVTPTARKIREGKVNGYKKYLSNEDILYINQRIKELQK